MKIALLQAEYALKEGEVPVGAVLVLNEKVISKSHNRKETLYDPTAHAEILAIKEASSILKNWRLNGATLYVTKEPCIMCAGAMIHARIQRLVYGCSDPKGGAVDSLYKILTDSRLNHQIEVVSAVLQNDCSSLLKKFFEERRTLKKNIYKNLD